MNSLESRLREGFLSISKGDCHPDAIISISEFGTPSMIKVLTKKEWLLESIEMHDDLAEHEFSDMVEGLYYADAKWQGEGEFSEILWLPTKAICLIEKGVHYE